MSFNEKIGSFAPAPPQNTFLDRLPSLNFKNASITAAATAALAVGAAAAACYGFSSIAKHPSPLPEPAAPGVDEDFEDLPLPISLSKSWRELVLLNTVRNGSAEDMNRMLDNESGDIDFRDDFLGNTLLHISAFHGRPEMTDLLISRGAATLWCSFGGRRQR